MTEKTQHDLLFTITALMFILFSTGMSVPGNVPVSSEPILIP